MIERKGKRRLAATAFLLEGLSNARYRFRVLKVREKIPKDNLYPIRLQRWSDHLWRKMLFCPVYPTSRLDTPAFLIPEENSPAVGATFEITSVPAMTYHIDVSDDVIEVSVQDAKGPERELVCRMLERAFTDRFRSQRDLFWKAQWTLFFKLRPENEHNREDLINAYRGLKFGVVYLENQGLCLVADIRTRYVGRTSLADYNDAELKTVLKSHLDLDLPIEDRASFIRDNGTVKIPCRYAGDTGFSVDSCRIKSSGETVNEYYARNYPNLKINPKDDAVFVKDREGGESLPVPKSRLFPIFTTEYEGVSNCSVHPQMTPNERMNAIRGFLNFLKDVKYGNIPIFVKPEVIVRERTVFIPPRLEFGGGGTLDPFPRGYVPEKDSSEFDSQIVKWRSSKIPALYNNGPYHNEPLPAIVLIYPDTLDRSVRETFITDLNKEVLWQTKQTLNFIRQISYQTGIKERMGSSILRVASELKQEKRRVLALIILWDLLHENVHGELKEVITPLLSQCTTERTVRGIVNQRNPQRAKSQTRNLALGILIEAGVKPWVIANPLYNDIYIGIDTLYGHVVYHYLYGTGGRIIERHVGESITRGRMQEAIKRPELARRLENPIKEIVNRGNKIKSIMVHRDGRWWPGEGEALHRALENLKRSNALPSDVKCTVVEIRKNHKPIRLFTLSEEIPSSYFQNPLPGTYLILDKDRALLTTTGRPGAWDNPGGRTAGTLLVQIVERIGEVDIQEVAEDIYRLTQLNWNAPDIEISLPVTIRWTDEALRETLQAHRIEEDELDVDDRLIEQEEEEEDLEERI